MSSTNILTEITSSIETLNSLIGTFKKIEHTIKNQNKFLADKHYNHETSKYSEADKHTIEALLQGYISNKEIVYFLEKENIKPFNPRYQVQKLMIAFDAPSRNFLLRKLVAKFPKRQFNDD